jgi:uncharacterized protein
MKTKRRFIAGAKCPKCELTDKIVLHQGENIYYAECVHCGHILKDEEPLANKKLKAIPIKIIANKS